MRVIFQRYQNQTTQTPITSSTLFLQCNLFRKHSLQIIEVHEFMFNRNTSLSVVVIVNVYCHNHYRIAKGWNRNRGIMSSFASLLHRERVSESHITTTHTHVFGCAMVPYHFVLYVLRVSVSVLLKGYATKEGSPNKCNERGKKLQKKWCE